MTIMYGWSGWHEGDECEPPEPDKEWLMIGPVDEYGQITEEYAVIVLRTNSQYFRDQPHDARGERLDRAQEIVNALNMQGRLMRVLECVQAAQENLARVVEVHGNASVGEDDPDVPVYSLDILEEYLDEAEAILEGRET